MNIKVNYIEEKRKKTYYRICGTKNKETMIYVHGLAGDSRLFHNQMKYFSDKFKIIAIDLPGHGKSDCTEEQTIEDFNRSIKGILEQEKIDKYILIGHSMGGCISLEHYKSSKDKIKALILISTAATLPIDGAILTQSILDFDNFIKDILSKIFDKKAGIFIRAAQRNMTEHEKKIIIDDLKLCTSFNYVSLLDQIDTPVLIIANQCDKIIPIEFTKEMHSTIKGAKLVIFDKKGHVPFFENSIAFNYVVEDFIRSILKK